MLLVFWSLDFATQSSMDWSEESDEHFSWLYLPASTPSATSVAISILARRLPTLHKWIAYSSRGESSTHFF